ncbi:MAG: DUF1566 domain-containing protein [Magnetococcales bacterium]|nr:DUF1566 domain-containing protein [Magnetococcales bacterium]
MTSDGTVWAWGDNNYGQAGPLATDDEQETPVEVPIPAPVTKISAGYKYTLALTDNGSVWAWGYNYYGQLGNGATETSATPVEVVGLTDVVDITVGYMHNLALKADGTLMAWGYNNAGQLGDGTTEDRYTPVEVMGLSDVIQMAAGSHSVVLKSDGTVWTWGRNTYGNLGDGTTADRMTPGIVPGLSDVKAIGVGSTSTLAITADGLVWSWGRNYYGKLGDGTTEDRYSPVQVIDIDGEPFSVYVVEGEDDDYEPDNTHHEATLLTPGETQSHSIDSEGDEDWYSFTLSLSSEATITLSGESGEMVIALYDADVENLGSDDGSSGEGTASISLDCGSYLPPGTYYLVVGESDNNATIASYEILLQTETCPLADSDGDGVPDVEDAFIRDDDEWNDNDGDGTGDNADTDDDNDGLPDSYETDYGFDSNDAADADEDADGDGGSNLEEYLFGSSPTDDEDTLIEGCDAKGHFTDVTCHHWAFDHIQAIGDTEISRGCGGGDYCPDTPLQRSEMAIFLLRGKYGGQYAPLPATGGLFEDVTTDYWAGHQIERLAGLGITNGCGSGRFCPSREITRAEMAVFLLRTKYGSDYQPPAATGEVFGDISSDYWAAAFIEQLQAEGAVAGTTEPSRECDEGNYCPSQNITRSEMAAFLNQAFGLDEPQADPGTVALVPKTGQTVSVASGDDGDLQTGVSWPDPRFTNNGDGTITDNMTGLVWMQDGGCWEGVARGQDEVEELNEGQKRCAQYTSHYSDWRLPSIRELQSLLNLGASSPSLPDGHPFVNMQINLSYWSNTYYRRYYELYDQYYTVKMRANIAYGIIEEKSSSDNFILPVRDASKIALLETMDPETTALVARTGQTESHWEGDDGDLLSGIPWPDPRFTDNGDGTITDNLTTLVWMKNATCWEAAAWLDALEQVADLNAGIETCEGYEGAHTDWRLPNRNEQLSLGDYSGEFADYPFDDREDRYWTSTPLYGDDSQAWYVNLEGDNYTENSGGQSEYKTMTNSYSAWPVRGGM